MIPTQWKHQRILQQLDARLEEREVILSQTISDTGPSRLQFFCAFVRTQILQRLSPKDTPFVLES